MRASALQIPNVRIERGITDSIQPIISEAGFCRVVIVRGTPRDNVLAICRAIEGCAEIASIVEVHQEPSLPVLETHLSELKTHNIDGIIAIGGGSVLDMAKALSGLIPAQESITTYLEVVGLGHPLDNNPIPWIAIPTTAGTGSEVTKNAVIDIPDAQRKVSLRDPRLLPHVALIDPALTDGTTKRVTLACGLDAITQCIEPYLSKKRTPLTDALVEHVIPKGLKALANLMTSETQSDRDAMALVSVTGGIALANSGLGVVHGFAGPLGSVTGAAHGEICAALLAHGLKAHQAYVTESELIARIRAIQGWLADALGGEPTDAFDTLERWIKNQGIAGLASLGLTKAQIPEVAIASQSSSSMKANPVDLDTDILTRILEEAL
jgi:alcohol dehydrogenase class IV